MSGEAALSSTDADEVKKARAVVKGKITTTVNKLQIKLTVQPGVEYDHKLISKSEVKDYCEDLETNFKLFKGLHERFCNLRETKDETELENLAVEDATYYDGVASKVYLIRDKKEEFDTSLRKYEEKQKLSRKLWMPFQTM